MKNKYLTHNILIILILIILFTLTSCADVQPNVINCVTGYQYGFFSGLWHGLIAPFSFIGSLFFDDIAVWAVNNNGGWYTFGFLLGATTWVGSGSSNIK